MIDGFVVSLSLIFQYNFEWRTPMSGPHPKRSVSVLTSFNNWKREPLTWRTDGGWLLSMMVKHGAVDGVALPCQSAAGSTTAVSYDDSAVLKFARCPAQSFRFCSKSTTSCACLRTRCSSRATKLRTPSQRSLQLNTIWTLGVCVRS